MPYLTKDQFAAMVRDNPHREIVEQQIFAGIPFAFRDAPADFDLLRNELAAGLKLDESNITVIGSGRTGFSLDPDKFGAPYGPHSDLDVAVVSNVLFDRCWLKLCALTRPSLTYDARTREIIKEHRQSNVFYGFMKMSHLVGVLAPESYDWNRAFKGLSRQPRLAGLDIKGRLYRTWDHVRLHQLYSLDCIGRVIGRDHEI
jgi:hypothetical protein